MFIEIIVFVLVTIFCYFAINIYLNYNKVKHIPGSWQVFLFICKIPFFSSFRYFGDQQELRDLVHSDTKLVDKETKTMRVSCFDQNIVNVCDPQMLKEIYVTKSQYFAKPIQEYNCFNILGLNILSVLDTDEWKKHHKVCAPAFSNKSYEHMCEVAVQSCNLLFEQKWESAIKKNNSFELEPVDFYNVTLDILGKAGFGTDLSLFSNDNSGLAFRNSLEVILHKGILLRRFVENKLLLKAIEGPLFKFEEQYNYARDTLERIIEKRTKELSSDESFERNDLLSLLVKANNEEQHILTSDELKSNALIFSLAGHETTSTLLQWIIYELAKNKEIQDKAREEIRTVLGNRNPTFDDYDSLNYINAIIYEGLRFHPPVAVVVKEAKKDVQIGKFHIPKSTIIFIDIYSSNSNEKYWDRAREFVPERFVDKEYRKKMTHDFSFIPFSMGQRKCIGFQFALFESFIILIKMLQNYNFELLSDNVYENAGITIAPGNLKVLVKNN
ncbi:hypothetical protein ABK040_007399 [Willaertia magna]